MSDNNHGGRRNGAGRPKSDNPRTQHQVRATADEWAMIKEFTRLIKANPDKASSIMKELSGI